MKKAIKTQLSILSQAKAMFIQHGYHHSSMKLAAEYAGVSRACLYEYFDSTEALLLAVLEAEQPDHAPQIYQQIADKQPSAEILQQVLDYYCQRLLANRPLARARYEYCLSHPAFLEAPYKSLVAALSHLILYGQRTGTFATQATPQQYAQHLALSLEGLGLLCLSMARPKRTIAAEQAQLYRILVPPAR